MFSVHLLRPFSCPILKYGSRLDNKIAANKILYNFNLTMKYNTNSLRRIKGSNSSILNAFRQIKIKLKRTDYRAGIITGLTGGTVILKHPIFCSVTCTAKKVSEKSIQPAFDWKKFIALIWQDYWSILGAIVAALVAAVMNIQLPIYLGDLINVMSRLMAVEGRGSFSSEMRAPVLNLLGLYMVQSAATFVYIYLLSGVGERLASKLKCLLFSSILRQDLEFFDKNRTGELVDCLTSDIQEFKSAFKMVLSQGLRSITQIVGCVVSMYVLSPPMTLGMLAVVPGIIVGGTFIGSLLRSVSAAAQQQAAVLTTNCEETIGNVRTVRAFANEQLECERFKEQVERAQTLYQKLGVGIALFQAGTNLFLNGMVLATLYVGGYLVAAQELNAGNLMSFLVATQTIQRSLAQISLLFGSYVRGIQAGARVFHYVNTEEKIPLTGGKTIPLHSLVADVEFENVSFSYPTRPKQMILENFNLKLPAGKTVAIVGTSGNGKSTIAALLERFYDVDSGRIRVGGVDIRELDPSWLRGQTIGMINQEPVLFATTILENIRYGRPDATDQEVLEAAKLANAHQFIDRFPDGYSTVLGERGVTVSGGQKQRIAIARALLKNPSILILDEATSALDTESEKVVQKALEEVCRNRSVLVIAHRLSTIQNADIIVVLNAGKIMEMGDHKSLLQMKGIYWNLMNQQNAANRGVA